MVKRFFVLLEKFFGVEMEGWFLWGGGPWGSRKGVLGRMGKGVWW